MLNLDIAALNQDASEPGYNWLNQDNAKPRTQLANNTRMLLNLDEASLLNQDTTNPGFKSRLIKRFCKIRK